CKCANVQMCKWANVQMCKCAKEQRSKFAKQRPEGGWCNRYLASEPVQVLSTRCLSSLYLTGDACHPEINVEPCVRSILKIACTALKPALGHKFPLPANILMRCVMNPNYCASKSANKGLY
ncbi:hypothetical protein G9A89_000311, partial [Geosiphon pyriformis]